jgi:hypothetical protein
LKVTELFDRRRSPTPEVLCPWERARESIALADVVQRHRDYIADRLIFALIARNTVV